MGVDNRNQRQGIHRTYYEGRIVLTVTRQLCIGDQVGFGEVQYFFRLLDGLPLAVVSMYLPPDPVMLEELYGTVWLCMYGGLETVCVLPISSIQAVVAVIPFDHDVERRSTPHFVVEKPGLDVGILSGMLAEGTSEEPVACND